MEVAYPRARTLRSSGVSFAAPPKARKHFPLAASSNCTLRPTQSVTPTK